MDIGHGQTLRSPLLTLYIYNLLVNNNNIVKHIT